MVYIIKLNTTRILQLKTDFADLKKYLGLSN